MPDTYINIFFCGGYQWPFMTFLVPKGYYETEDVAYLMNGAENRTVIKDGSFQYLTDAAGKPVTGEGAALFEVATAEPGRQLHVAIGIISSPLSKSSHF